MKRQFNIGNLTGTSKKYSMDDNSVHAMFYIDLAVAIEILERISTDKRQILVFDARQNFIVNLVTIIEVFCKRLIVEYSGYWDKTGISELLQEKITLNQAFELITESQHHDITKELVLIDSYSFSNFDSITLVFSKLTGKKDFSNLIGEKINKQNWEESLKKLFESRNKIIHDGDELFLNQKDVNEFKNLVTQYIESILKYVNSNYKRRFT